MTTEFPRLILDANIMVSALVGRSFPVLLDLIERGVRLFAPVQQIAETGHVLSERMGLEDEWVDGQLRRLIEVVLPLHPALLARLERRCRLRLHDRGQPDWPVLAASVAVDAAIWSHDKDFFGSGAPVWSTVMLTRQLETQDA